MDNGDKFTRERGWNLEGGRQGKTLRNPEIMQAVLDDPGVSAEELAVKLHIGITQVREAKNILRELPELVPEILDGSLSLHKATEIVRHGDRIPCPVCNRRGYVFKKRK